MLGLAYRMLGGAGDAEDVVQEVWLRWSKADRSGIENPAGWLTTVTTRLALDRLRALRRRREVYVGPWLPDPVTTESLSDNLELAESLTLAFLVLLERLGPVERAVFLLAEVFGEPYSLVSDALGKSEAACRQIATRARRKVRDQSGATSHGQAAPVELLGKLLGALLADDEEGALRLLAPDVVLISDGGPQRRAARLPVVGSYRVHRLMKGGWRLFGFRSKPGPSEWPPAHFATVNAMPAIVVESPRGPVVISAEARNGQIEQIWIRLNPEKTKGMDLPASML